MAATSTVLVPRNHTCTGACRGTCCRLTEACCQVVLCHWVLSSSVLMHAWPPHVHTAAPGDLGVLRPARWARSEGVDSSVGCCTTCALSPSTSPQCHAPRHSTRVLEACQLEYDRARLACLVVRGPLRLCASQVPLDRGRPHGARGRRRRAIPARLHRLQCVEP